MSLIDISIMCGMSVRRCALALVMCFAALSTSLHAHAHTGVSDPELGVESSQCVVCACSHNPCAGLVAPVALEFLEEVHGISLVIGMCVLVLPPVASSFSLARAPPGAATFFSV